MLMFLDITRERNRAATMRPDSNWRTQRLCLARCPPAPPKKIQNSALEILMSESRDRKHLKGFMLKMCRFYFPFEKISEMSACDTTHFAFCFLLVFFFFFASYPNPFSKRCVFFPLFSKNSCLTFIRTDKMPFHRCWILFINLEKKKKSKIKLTNVDSRFALNFVFNIWDDFRNCFGGGTTCNIRIRGSEQLQPWTSSERKQFSRTHELCI